MKLDSASLHNQGAQPGSAPAECSKGELFDHIAREHDGFAFTEEDAPKLGLLCERLGPLFGLKVLEPGCGSGHLTEYLAYWTEPDGCVVAFDPSREMLKRTQSRIAAHKHVSTHLSTLEELELGEASFDLVLCFRVWPHFDDADQALRRVVRWLRPGGRLLIVHWLGRRQLAEIHASHHSVVTDLFPTREELESGFLRHGLKTQTWIDTEEEIFIEAIRN